MNVSGTRYIGVKMGIRILIMGLPGSGKTTLAVNLTAKLASKKVTWLNADEVRAQFNDWDFTRGGRIRQACRMRELADEELAKDKNIIIIDMVSPLLEMRDIIAPDFLIWCNTIDEGRYEDTNKMFVPPDVCDIEVTERNADRWLPIVMEKLRERKI